MTNILNSTKYTKELLEQSRISLNVEVNLELFNEYKNKVLGNAQKDIAIDGFRRGQVPLKKVEETLGSRLYEDLLNTLLPEVTSEIVIKEELKPISQVKYDVKSLSPQTTPDKPAIVFVVEFVNLPVVKLPDLTKLETKKIVASVTEEEIDKYLEELTKRNEKLENKEEISPIPTRDEAKERLHSSNEYVADQDYRNNLLKEIANKVELGLPEEIYQEESTARYNDYVKKITELGLNLEDFLKMQNTSIEDLKKRFESEAKDSITISMILSQIILDEKLEITEDEINNEISMIDDVTTRDQYDNPEARERIRLIMLQQKALERLLDKAK